MEIKDLKPNTFYTRENNDELHVFKFEKYFKKSFIVTRTSYHENWEICVFSGIRNSTIEEQLWLEACIKANKFIPKNEIIFDLKKESEYISGRWYKSIPYENSRGGDTYYAKFLKTDDNGDFVSSSSRVSGMISKDRYSFFSGYIWHLMEDLSEIQPFLPNGHEDKIKKLSILDKFEIGDIVVSLTNLGSTRKSGDLYKILPESRPEGLSYKPGHFSEKRLDWRLATKEETKAFNEGIKNIHNINKNDINDIFQECIKKYPVGTKYKNINTDRIYTVEKQHFTVSNIKTINAEEGKGILYCDGQYAEIILKPKVKPLYSDIIKVKKLKTFSK